MNYQKQRIVWNSSKSGGLILGGLDGRTDVCRQQGTGLVQTMRPSLTLEPYCGYWVLDKLDAD